MAALSCLSDYPGKLKSLFKDRHITEEGTDARNGSAVLRPVPDVPDGLWAYDNVSRMYPQCAECHLRSIALFIYIYLLACKVIPCDVLPCLTDMMDHSHMNFDVTRMANTKCTSLISRKMSLSSAVAWRQLAAIRASPATGHPNQTDQPDKRMYHPLVNKHRP